MQIDYRQRFAKVIAYIDAHAADALDLETLSHVAAFSKHHFHRQFTAAFDLPVAKYVQHLRLKRAAYRLAFRQDAPVIEIALDSGYEAPEAFARAFKQWTGQTPTEFRRLPAWPEWAEICRPLAQIRSVSMTQRHSISDVKVVETPDIRVAVLEHRGDPALIGDSIRRFIAWRKEVRLHPKASATFNVLYDDPDNTPVQDFRLDICAATDRAIEPNDRGIVAKTIPGGRCAVLRHIGSDDSLDASARYLYGEWLPQSGAELRDFPLYCQRIKFYPDVAEHEAVTDFFLPIR